MKFKLSDFVLFFVGGNGLDIKFTVPHGAFFALRRLEIFEK